MKIEGFEEQLNGKVIGELKALRKTIDALASPIYQVFYEFIQATGSAKQRPSHWSESTFTTTASPC